MTSHPECFAFESHETFISEEKLQSRIGTGEVDPDRDVEELDLENPHHSGIFTGPKGFARTHVHECGLCGFQAYNPSYFAVLDSYGLPPTRHQPSTEEYMVSQLSEKFGFLKKMNKNELAILKGKSN